MSNLELAAKSNVEPLSAQNPNIEPPESPILNQELQDWSRGSPVLNLAKKDKSRLSQTPTLYV